MKDAVPYIVTEDDLELRRPGFKDIMNELRNNAHLMRMLEEFALDEDGDLSKIELYLQHNAKVIWHERNPNKKTKES